MEQLCDQVGGVKEDEAGMINERADLWTVECL
jgi:hypothetical protein